jgi:hypothetical protein
MGVKTEAAARIHQPRPMRYNKTYWKLIRNPLSPHR